ncbi:MULTISPECIES: SpoIID/LytB domain-containing protein [Aeromicrobium]|uniref:SpoIID/LytB domain-containing protein n=1 Tax=Aeromicrobium TaxID=2040 RepID=UPI002580C7F4|nr:MULTISPECIES: SpoIID/LytB domain-containing protein [Aeromicrobium]
MHSWPTRCSIGLTTIAVAGACLMLPAPAQAAGTDIVVSRPAATAPTEATTTAPVSEAVEVEQTAVEPDPAADGDAVERATVDPFRMVGVTWGADSDAADVTVRVQVRTNGAWSDWQRLDVEDSADGGRPGTSPLWTEAPADGVAVEVKAASGTAQDVKVTTIDPGKPEVVTPVTPASYSLSEEEEGTTEAVAADGTPKVVPMPSIITRAQWKAGAGTSCSAPVTRPKALGVVIHHTAGSNTYTKSESAGLVRSYQTYHVKGRGWCDIGYNFLVDRFGQIFEGRKGGMTKQVRAAHSGVDAVNQYATGISMMGHFDYVKPSAAMQSAVVRLAGWRLKFFGANPKGTYATGGKRYSVINGHRNVTSTGCPGKYGYAWIGAVGGLRDRAATYISKATSAAGAPTAAPAPIKTYATPKGVKVSASTTSAKVSWAAVAGAPGYRVMVSPTGSSAGAKYYNVGATSATITGLYSRRTYVFRVSVWNPTAKKRVSPYTAKPMPTARTRAFTAPTGLKLTTRTSTGLRFAWKAQAGAPAYRVMYWETGTTKKRYVTAYKNAVAIKKLKRGGKYQVRVSVFSPGTGERVSAYSAKPYPAGTTLGASGAKAPAPAPKPKPAPAPAPSARNVVKPAGGKVTFKGHGYGHGIGMSQYGAEGGARAGQKYDAILKKYYPGTKLTFKSATIRVQVSADTTNSVQVKHQSGLKLRTLANNAVQALPAKVGSRTVSDWTIDTAPSNRGLNTVSYKSGSAWYAFRTFKSDAQFEGPATIRLVMPNGSTRAYRGALRSAKPTKTTRDTVNVLSLEAYVRGVVAREMPSSWSMEALKAQSVAARTFGSRYLGSSRHYDICDTVSCQVYGGYADETKRTNDAILGTKGKILTYQGAPALTQFSSSSGGFTNQGSTPYLKAVSDPWDNWSGNRNHAWSHAVSASAIQKKYPTIGKLTSITVTKRNGHGSLGGRVVSLKLQGSKASRTITGVDARWAFGLKSDWFGF